MSDYILMGGPFMWPLVIIAVIILLLFLKKGFDVFVNADPTPAQHRRANNVILQLGIFSFFFGLLGQAIGLIEGFSAIQAAADISPAMVMGGLKVSMITPVFGLITLLGSLIAWSVLKYRIDGMEE